MLPPFLAPPLCHAAAPVIANVLAQGGRRTARPWDEVSAVCTMTLDGFDEIAAAWAPILRKHGYRIDLRTVFCHSRPHVRFSPIPHPNYPGGRTPRVCELADLLIVMDYVDRVRRIDDRRAVLIQAKMLKGGNLQPSGREWVQHELLAWLPEFTFVDSAFDPRPRDLTNGTPLVGLPPHTAEYGGIILGNAPEWRHHMTTTAAPWFKSPVSLADHVAAMATGDSRCGRKAVKRGRDAWSFTVEGLLQITAVRPISQAFSVARGNDNVSGCLNAASSLPAAGAGNGGNHSDSATPEWPEGPISTIHMTLSRLD